MTSVIQQTTEVTKQLKKKLCSVIATEPVDILFRKTIDNIKVVNGNYVMPQVYDFSDSTKEK